MHVNVIKHSWANYYNEGQNTAGSRKRSVIRGGNEPGTRQVSLTVERVHTHPHTC